MTKKNISKLQPGAKFFGVLLTRVMDIPESDTSVVRGFFTSDQRDEAGDIITRGATERAIPKFRRWGNIRYMHLPRPVGKITRIGEDDGLAWNEVEIEVIDPEAVFMVRRGLLTALSVGILINIDDVEFMEDGGWLINDYMLAEISLVDHPCNYDAFLTTVKDVFQEVARQRGSQEVAAYLDTIKEEIEMGDEVEQVVSEQETVEVNRDLEDAIVINEQAEPEVEQPVETEALQKSPPCRQAGESVDDCVGRKIPEILDENPDMDRDQAVAIAHSMCEESCSESDDSLAADSQEDTGCNCGNDPGENPGEVIENSEAGEDLTEKDITDGGEEAENIVEPDVIVEDEADVQVEANLDIDNVETVVETPEPDTANEIDQLKQELALIRGLLKVLTEALQGQDEHVEDEDSQDAQSPDLQKQIEDLKAENDALKAEIDELRLPTNRGGLVKTANQPEEVEEQEVEAPAETLNLKQAVRKYLLNRTPQ